MDFQLLYAWQPNYNIIYCNDRIRITSLAEYVSTHTHKDLVFRLFVVLWTEGESHICVCIYVCLCLCHVDKQTDYRSRTAETSTNSFAAMFARNYCRERVHKRERDSKRKRELVREQGQGLYLNLSGEVSRSLLRILLMVSSMVLPILSLISLSFSLKGNWPRFCSHSSSHFPRPSLESYLSPAGGGGRGKQG